VRPKGCLVSFRAARARPAAGRLLPGAGCCLLLVACLGLPAGAARAADAAAGAEPAAAEEAEIDASLVIAGQQIGARASATGRRQRRLNARADVEGTIPVLRIGGGHGSLVGHLRSGVGTGVTTRQIHSGSVNNLGFDSDNGVDDHYGIVAEAYYQHLHPLGGSTGASERSGAGSSHLALEVGKFDMFNFFDRNEAADDEARAFLNESFVHNPMLGAGGDGAGDEFGFSPGLRTAYFNGTGSRHGWGVSLGLLGAGDEATTSRLPRRPMVFLQADLTTQGAGGDTVGTVRLYAWRNRLAEDFDGEPAVHDGWGVSVDHRIGNWVTVLGRYGRRTRGAGFFDRALTAGVVASGQAWGRADDSSGFAVGGLSTDSTYRRATAAEAPPGAGASGTERVLEVFYRFALGKSVEVTPDFQYIHRPAGDPSGAPVRAVAIRFRFSH